MNAPLAERPSSLTWIALARRAWGWRGTVLALGVGAAVAAAIVMLIAPEQYRAQCVLLPPPQESSTGLAAAMLAQSGMDQLMGIGGAGISSELYVEILGSRSVADGVIDSLHLLSEFHLERKGREEGMETARALLRQRVVFHSSAMSGVVTITATDLTGYFPKFRAVSRERSRRRCADIANAYCDQLDRVNLAHSISQAKASRSYLEAQIALAQADRDHAAKALLDFQTSHGAISIEDQTRMAIETAGDLKSQIMAKRVELGMVSRTESEAGPRSKRLRSEIEELEHQYEGLEKGMWQSMGARRTRPVSPQVNGTALANGSAQDPSSQDPSSQDPSISSGPERDRFVPPLTEIPDLAFRYASLLGEVKTQETLVDILTQQYYEAKLQEARDITTLHVLDRANPPVHKHAPRRIRTVAIATFLGLLAGTVLAWGGEEVRRIRGLIREAEIPRSA